MAKRNPEAAERPPFRFEDGLKELEAAVEALESGELGLEDSIKRYEEGMALYRACVKRLDEAKRRIEKLLDAPGDGAPAVAEPFEHAEASVEPPPAPPAGGRPPARPAPDAEELPF